MNKSLENKLINEIGTKRYNHSLRVEDIAIELAKIYGADIEKTKTAAVLHDCGKIPEDINLLKRASDFDIILDDSMESNHELIHGFLGAKIAEKEYGIEDREILDAIYYHTIGRKNMTILDKIIYIADYIEPKRDFRGVEEIRQMAFIDIDKSILMAMENTIIFLISVNKLIHLETVKARNYLLIQDSIKNKTNL